ncbi:MAG: magnesium transporter [Alphaproteobacteria bacterium]|nr:magnesium transporter [Alphaproteobacteria bacterium]
MSVSDPGNRPDEMPEAPIVGAPAAVTPPAESGERRSPAPAVAAALAAGDRARAIELSVHLHAADLADLLQELSTEDRQTLIGLLRERFDPDTLVYLNETVREEVLARLGSAEVAAAVSALDSDDAVDLVGELEPDARAAIMARLAPSDRAILETALSYPEESAGRLMQREVVTVPPHWRVGDAIDYMRARAEHLPRDFYEIHVVDEQRRPVAVVPLSRLMRNRRLTPLTEVMQRKMRLISVTADQEEVAYQFRQYGLVSAPVVDAEGRLLGAITVDDVVEVIQEEAEEDVLRLSGVREDDFYAAVVDTTRARFSWLFINLLTAILASIVIGFFEGVIEKVVALAVLMPIVASMGGNAGTQTLAVAVRALAVKELTATNAARIIVKETIVGGINGFLFAILMGLAAWAWFGAPVLGGLIASAMIINLLAAGCCGVLIPVVLDRFGVDPAVGSAVVLTTVTDVVGFMAFLGLASLVLL